MPKLGVNIDHIATLRQQRTRSALDLLFAADTCLASGADSVVVHLREDRRHIQDEDVRALRKRIKKRLNLEMSVAGDILRLACRVNPDQATLVPERRQELTTEGGLDVVRMKPRIATAVRLLKKKGIQTSLFIEPDLKQVRAARHIGADMVELHTGRYASSRRMSEVRRNLSKIREAVLYGHDIGLRVSAGHGLDYNNVCAIARLPHMEELNIGYAVVCYAVFVGLDRAVRRMKKIIG